MSRSSSSGVALVLPGASQPFVAPELGLDLAESGLLASALSLGLGIGVVAAGPAVDRWPRGPLFAGAVALAALALVVLPPFGTYVALLVALALLGAGCGVFETVLNTVIPERAPRHAASRLAVAHAAATVGAAVGAGVVGFAAESRGWPAAWRGLAVALVGVGLVGAFTKLDRSPVPRTDAIRTPGGDGIDPAIVPLALGAAAYVGIEGALTVFLPALAQGRGAAEGGTAISAFWLGLFVSRIVFAVVARRPGTSGRSVEVAVLLGCGVGGALMLAIAPWAASRPHLWAGGVGFVFGPVFPLLVALTSRRFPGARGAATGIVIGAGSVGGVLLPWLVGLGGGALGVAWAVASLAAASLLIAFAARGQADRRPRPAR